MNKTGLAVILIFLLLLSGCAQKKSDADSIDETANVPEQTEGGTEMTNNEIVNDSWDYSLAIRLTDNYHNELVNDLIPAVEGTYSAYAEDTTLEGIKKSRDHRAFCGFSMGSVATWRTFQHSLDYFRYFMPSSGNLTSDGEYMASMVRDSGHEWNDFFIFAASGTDDFAYASFRYQIEAMANVSDGTFRYADNEAEGNLYFLEQEGGSHSGEYAIEYFYNGLCWIWK